MTSDPAPDQVEALFAQVDASIGSTEEVVAAFRREMDRMSCTAGETRRQVAGLDRAVGSGLRKAFDDIVFDGGKASDALRQVARGLSKSVLDQALAPVQTALGSAMTGLLRTGVGAFTGGVLPFAEGGSFTGGRVRAFASGGVVHSATTFPMRGGRLGLMGEAGPEAIMPLARGPDGSLGVRSAGAGARPMSVTVNISTPDAQSFRRSRSQIAADMRRALGQGNRNQ